MDFVHDSYDSIFYDLNKKISIQRVGELYYDLKDIVIDAYENSTFANIKLLGVDLAFEECSLGGYNIIVLSVLTNIPPGPIQFDPYDDWRYGNEEGYCDPTIPSSLDAGKVLTSEINNSLNPSTLTRKWFNYNSLIVVFKHSNYRSPYDELNNYTDYYIFYAINDANKKLFIGENEYCVSSYEMYFYKNNTQSIFTDYLDLLPPEYSFECCWLVGELIYTHYPEEFYIHHITQAEFSIEIDRAINDLPTDIQ